MGFSNVSEYANADEAGQVWFTQFRKAVTATSTVPTSYVDYTYFAGSPLSNFYASTPLEAAYIDETRGIRVPDVSPARQYLKTMSCMCASNSATSTGARQQQLSLCDYLMYYPFVDTDSTALQEMTQTVTLPRYTSGQVLAIAQSAASTIGQFTMTYTNQDGVSGRVSPNCFTQIVAGGGQSLIAYRSNAAFNPFVPLQAGDSGVKSIESVTFTVAGGGLMAFVIVQPLLTFFVAEECRRQTSGDQNSFGSSTEYNSVIMGKAPEIKDGAILGLISKGQGSRFSSTLVGYIETVWN